MHIPFNAYRITALALFTGMLSLQPLFVSAQANYPNKTVKMIVPLTPGSGADIAGRIVAKNLSESWKQPVIIENRPGAGGLVGTGVVVNSDPDGYTLLVQSASYAANPAIYKKLPYDLKSLKDVNILMPEYFNQTMGIKMLHVPFKGSPEAIQETIAGRTAYYMAPLQTAIAQIQGGKVRALGLTSATRAEAAPDIPTIAEQGFPNFEIGLWVGVWAPSATPASVLQKINTDINRALQDSEVKAAYSKAGITIKPMNLSETEKFVRSEITKYTKIAKDAGIEPQ